MADGACSGPKRRRVLRMKVLFVCTGNICRSPIAERVLRHLGEAEGIDLDVSSAGTRAINGLEMHPESVRVLRSKGLDYHGFRSQMLTPELAAQSDLVLGMTREHRAVARQLAPSRWKRMYALREIADVGSDGGVGKATHERRIAGPTDSTLDIEDPMGKPAAVFDQVGGVIQQSMYGVIEWITQRQAEPSIMSGTEERQ